MRRSRGSPAQVQSSTTACSSERWTTRHRAPNNSQREGLHRWSRLWVLRASVTYERRACSCHSPSGGTFVGVERSIRSHLYRANLVSHLSSERVADEAALVRDPGRCFVLRLALAVASHDRARVLTTIRANRAWPGKPVTVPLAPTASESTGSWARRSTPNSVAVKDQRHGAYQQLFGVGTLLRDHPSMPGPTAQAQGRRSGSSPAPLPAISGPHQLNVETQVAHDAISFGGVHVFSAPRRQPFLRRLGKRSQLSGAKPHMTQQRSLTPAAPPRARRQPSPDRPFRCPRRRPGAAGALGADVTPRRCGRRRGGWPPPTPSC